MEVNAGRWRSSGACFGRMWLVLGGEVAVLICCTLPCGCPEPRNQGSARSHRSPGLLRQSGYIRLDGRLHPAWDLLTCLTAERMISFLRMPLTVNRQWHNRIGMSDTGLTTPHDGSTAAKSGWCVEIDGTRHHGSRHWPWRSTGWACPRRGSSAIPWLRISEASHSHG